MTTNLLKDENTKLRTKVHMLENEIGRKEKLVDELLMQQDTNYAAAPLNNGGQISTKSS
jgi:hypothetical protein